ncbi:MAG: NAD-dependent epimerase/dehydratase family protein [Gammaproteobacteria bacterium]|nr:NAD-dependent epimerase/dehydratase family protein [Gammaproteobacteria bacterium]
MKTQFVIAGAGYTGRRLAARLLQQGAVTVIARRAASVDSLDDNFDKIIAELDTAAATSQIDADATIIYLAPPPTAGEDDPTFSAFLANLHGNPRVVYISTSGVYGDCDGALVDESREPAPQTARALRRVAAEQALQDWSRDHNRQQVILRVSGIYGPGRLPLERLRRRTPVLRAEDAGPGNRIHIDDLVSCCVQAATLATPPAVVNVCDGNHMSSTEFTRLVATEAGLPPPREIPLDQARKEFTAMRWSFLAESRRLDNTCMRERLKVELRYPDPRAGIRASLPP